jgi:hypothetical protein
MKKFLITIITLFIVIPVYGIIEGTPAYTHISLNLKKHHTEVNIPADMPDVYYDSQNGVITIVDYANVTYYVTIYDDWWNAVLSTTLVGGGTIDVSSLTSGDYTIEISTSWNNQYEGTFTVP